MSSWPRGLSTPDDTRSRAGDMGIASFRVLGVGGRGFGSRFCGNGEQEEQELQVGDLACRERKHAEEAEQR